MLMMSFGGAVRSNSLLFIGTTVACLLFFTGKAELNSGSVSNLNHLGVTNLRTAPEPRQKVLLISLDGFRHDYIEKAAAHSKNVSAFEAIWDSGFRVVRVENEFTTLTAPNHFSMVTGLHEESHGVVDNSFFDPNLNISFSLGSAKQAKESRWFDTGAEPIWVTSEKHGLKCGITTWPGSQAEIKMHRPSKFYPVYDDAIPLRSRIDDVLNWLAHKNFSLALLYYHEPDRTGHQSGPNSVEVLSKVEELNADLSYLLQQLKGLPQLSRSLNIILTSDHGMTEVSTSKIIVLDDFVSNDMYFSYESYPKVLWALWPKHGVSVDDLYIRLVGKHEKMHVYRKTEVPQRMYYSNNERIAPVIVYAELGWLIAKNKMSAAATTLSGAHGYDPVWPDMSPFFLATGPGFVTLPNRTMLPSLQMVDVYPMLCHLLGLTHPAPHNGSLSRIAHLFRYPPSPLDMQLKNYSAARSFIDFVAVGLLFLVAILLAVTFIAVACKTSTSPFSFITSARRGRQSQDCRGRERLRLADVQTNSNTSSSKTARRQDLEGLLDPLSDEDEVLDSHYVDDATFMQLLREPRHP